MRSFFWLLYFLNLVSAAAEAASDAPLKYGAWGVSFALVDKHFSGAEEHSERGQAVQVGMSWSTLRPLWLLSSQGEIQLGPYAAPTKAKTKTDFFGTSFEISGGVKLFGPGFRSERGVVGIGLACRYSDEVGRLVGSPKTDEDGRLITTYEIGLNGAFLSPSFFYTRIRVPRAQGNSPSELVTRIEGVKAELALDLPVLAAYRARYRLHQAGSALDGGVTKVAGTLGGYSLTLRLTSYLGI